MIDRLTIKPDNMICYYLNDEVWSLFGDGERYISLNILINKLHSSLQITNMKLLCMLLSQHIIINQTQNKFLLKLRFYYTFVLNVADSIPSTNM